MFCLAGARMPAPACNPPHTWLVWLRTWAGMHVLHACPHLAPERVPCHADCAHARAGAQLGRGRCRAQPVDGHWHQGGDQVRALRAGAVPVRMGRRKGDKLSSAANSLELRCRGMLHGTSRLTGFAIRFAPQKPQQVPAGSAQVRCQNGDDDAGRLEKNGMPTRG